MGLLLKSGKQILGLSSAAASAKSRQQLGISSAYKWSNLLTTTRSMRTINISHHHGRFLGANNNKIFSTNTTQYEGDNDLKIPPMTLKRYFAGLFTGRRYSPLPPTPIPELLGAFMELAEESKYYPEDRLHLVIDEICPIMKELLYRMTEKDIVKFINEFARRAASPSSPPPIVIDPIVKDIVDKLPPRIIYLFQGIMINTLRHRFDRRGRTPCEVTIHPYPPASLVVTADVSCIVRETLKVFVVKDYLITTGTNKDALLLGKTEATIHHIMDLPICPYSHDELTSSILEENEGRGSQLKIVLPIIYERKEELLNRPRVFQLNIDTEGTHQG